MSTQDIITMIQGHPTQGEAIIFLLIFIATALVAYYHTEKRGA